MGREFVGSGRVVLILGDNIFYGHGLPALVESAVTRGDGATIFCYRVSDPTRYGVVELDDQGKAISIEEKPKAPRSQWAVTGLYVYDNRVLEIAAGLKLSERGEIEITDVNRAYMELGELRVERMGRGYAWLDTGTHTSLIEASQFVQIVEQRQGMQNLVSGRNRIS